MILNHQPQTLDLTPKTKEPEVQSLKLQPFAFRRPYYRASRQGPLPARPSDCCRGCLLLDGKNKSKSYIPGHAHRFRRQGTIKTWRSCLKPYTMNSKKHPYGRQSEFQPLNSQSSTHSQVTKLGAEGHKGVHALAKCLLATSAGETLLNWKGAFFEMFNADTTSRLACSGFRV